MKVLFFGTPPIAVPILDWLVQTQTVVGVVCQPDRPAGRGYVLRPPPTKIYAQKKSLPLFQPEGPWTEPILASLRALGAEVGIVVAYGRLIPRGVFTLPQLGCANIHFSCLPKYRGAAPMQWALINGDKSSGVTCFWLDEGMDTGPISHQKSCDIEENDDAISLREKLVVLSIQVLNDFFTDLSQHRIIKTPQQGQPTKAPQLTKEMSFIDWHKSAFQIHNQVRAMKEWPCARTRFHVGTGEKQLKILTSVCGHYPLASKEGKPGVVVEASKEEGLVVQTGDGLISLKEVQPEARTIMSAWNFWQGARLTIGEKFF